MVRQIADLVQKLPQAVVAMVQMNPHSDAEARDQIEFARRIGA